MFRATVVASFPWAGLVIASRTIHSTGIAGLTAVRPPVAGSLYGATILQTLTPGTLILCDQGIDSAQSVFRGTIPGPYDKKTVIESNTASFLTQLNPYTQDLSCVKSLQTLVLSNNNKTYPKNCGVYYQALPGDVQIGDKNAGAIFIHRLGIDLTASPMDYTSYNAADNSITSTAAILRTCTPRLSIEDSPTLRVQSSIHNPKQAFGLYADGAQTPLVKQTQNAQGLNLRYDQKLVEPLYRRQTIEGNAVQGKIQTVVIPPYTASTTSTTQYYPSQTVFPAVYSKSTALNGNSIQATASGHCTVKTPIVPGIQQQSVYSHYNMTVDPPQQLDEDKLAQNLENAALYKQVREWLPGSAYSQAQSQLQIENRLVDTTLAATPQYKEADNKSRLDQHKPIPKYVDVTDPVTGKTTRYYDTTSFISQQPDGSIFIKDGYGSQIRMSMGNIYISSALDTFIRPGRDLVAMAPRLCSMDSNGDTVVNAKQDLVLCGGVNATLTGGNDSETQQGVTVVQNRSSKTSVTTGLLLRSTAGTTVVGTQMYIGLNTANSPNSHKVTKGTGTIILDGGNGNIVSTANNQQHTAQSTYTTASGQSYTQLAGNKLINRADAIVNDGQVRIQAVAGPLKMTAPGGIQTTYAVGGTHGLQVRSNLAVHDNIVCYKGIQAAQSIVGGGAVGTNKQLADKLKALPAEPVPVQQDQATLVQKAAKALAQSIYQDSYLLQHQGTFPQSVFNGSYIMPGMCWQDQARTDANTCWKPQYIKSTKDSYKTAPYPGKDAWNDGNILYMNQNDTPKLEQSILGSSYYTALPKPNKENK